MNISDLFNNKLDLNNDKLICLDLSEKETINGSDLFNKPISNISTESMKVTNPKNVIQHSSLDLLRDPPKLNTPIKINKLKLNSEDKLDIEEQTPVKLIKVEVPETKPKPTYTQENKVVKINKLKLNSEDKLDIEEQTPVKLIKVEVPETKPKPTYTQENKVVKINIIKTDVATNNDQDIKEAKIMTKINNLELENKLLSKKLAEMTTAYVNVSNYNKNLLIALSMRR